MRAAGAWAIGVVVALALEAMALSSPAAQAAPGDLDPSFGTGGKVITDLGGSEYTQDAALQPDGKVVVLVERGDATFDEFVVARYLANGALDTTFGSSGVTTTDFLSEDAYARPTAVAIQPNGKIIAVGSVLPPFGEEGEGGFAVARYNADGSLDPTFSGDGKAIVFENGSTAEDVVVQPDGKIVVAGSFSGNDIGNDVRLALARFNPDGTLDSTFSGDGLQITGLGNIDHGRRLRLDTDGGIILLGTREDGSAAAILARYDPDGALDPTFDGDGVRVDTATFADDFLVLPNGKFLMVGAAPQWQPGPADTLRLTRLNPDGSLDPAFSGDGRHALPVGDDTVVQAIALQADGKVLVGGSYGSTFLSNWPLVDSAVFRLNPTGTLDPTFSADGKAIIDMGGDFDGFAAVLLQPDEKIVGAGLSHRSTESGSIVDLALARLEGSGPPPDLSPPDTTITSGPGISTTDPTPTFAFASSETGSSFECRVDDAVFTPCSAPHTTAPLTLGSHTFEVRATDPAGNTDPTPARHAFNVVAPAPLAPPPAAPAPPPADAPTTTPSQPRVTRTCLRARRAKHRAKRGSRRARKQLRRINRLAATRDTNRRIVRRKRRLRRVVVKRKRVLRRANRRVRRACR